MLYRLPAEESYAARVSWDRTFVFWRDERWVPADDEQSNQRMARNELLDRVSIPLENIRPILTAGIEPRDSAAAAERQFRALFKGEPRPDLMLSGIGVDGHTASLFPGTSELLKQEAIFAANQVPQLGTLPSWLWAAPRRGAACERCHARSATR
jgi:6-phosphogluconolactonase